MSDAEVMTTAIVAAVFFGGNFEKARALLSTPQYIPNMLSKSHFNRRLHRIEWLLLTCFETLAEVWKQVHAARRVVGTGVTGMNRTDRLLAIVLELQAKRNLRAEDLAATFEVNKRTIYRDIQALSEAGVPIVSAPGPGYSLVEGYFLPPLAFTTDEAIMLLLGSDFMAQHFDAQYRAAAQTAHSKIEAVLPGSLRQAVRYLQESIRFIASNALDRLGEPELLRQVRRAIIERKTVRLHYTKRVIAPDESPESQREADPYGLVHMNNTWVMIAYCHLRKAMRSFRLDRMDNLKVQHKTFTRPAHFVLRREPDERRNLVMRAQFDAQRARWVRESPSFYMVSAEENAAGLLVTLRVRRAEDVFQWLLSWGAHVRVLAPESLRQRLVEEAEKIIENHPTLLT